MNENFPNGVWFHRASSLFPLMPPDQLSELAESIRTRGQLVPIWVDEDGRIIDGRNRWIACVMAGVEPITRRFDEGIHGPVLDFVMASNFRRKNLDEVEIEVVKNIVAKIERGELSIDQIENGSGVRV